MRDLFRRFSHATSNAMGTPITFVLALAACVVWAVSGPLFGYSDTWQLVINTATTVLTFLAVFLIQNTQNRDAKAMHLKLDELIKGVEGARTRLVDLENLTDDQLEELQDEFRRIHKHENGKHKPGLEAEEIAKQKQREKSGAR
ncbi:MAG: low affinity iron permease family protein [Dehalococcoidia bacterium]